MKKIFILLATALVLVSCDDGFLDKKPLDKLSEEAVFNSDALAEAYVNALYTVLPGLFPLRRYFHPLHSIRIHGSR